MDAVCGKEFEQDGIGSLQTCPHGQGMARVSGFGMILCGDRSLKDKFPNFI